VVCVDWLSLLRRDLSKAAATPGRRCSKEGKPLVSESLRWALCTRDEGVRSRLTEGHPEVRPISDRQEARQARCFGQGCSYAKLYRSPSSQGQASLAS
jgi:hypothetical protein